MDALVIAGGIPAPEDPLFPYTQGKGKALVDVAGKPMTQWVLDALSGARRVERVVVAGLPADCGLFCSKPTTFLPDLGSMLSNVKTGLETILATNPHGQHALIVSCDIPAITPEMVDWRVHVIEEAGSDLDYAVVKRDVMERRFPGSRRSYTRLKDVEVCGADMNGVRLEVATDESLWARIIEARKSAVKQAALLGFDVLFLLLTRRMTLAEAEDKVSRRLHLKGHACLAPYAEIGMDVDKPFQLELMRRDLTGRAAPAA
jgi:GTP:adenosylcobinamide-phosphate guanylyltransferase